MSAASTSSEPPEFKDLLLAPTAAVPTALFDLTELYQIAQGETDFVLSIVDSFLITTPQLIAQLSAATQAGEWQRVKFLIHKITPSLKLLRAHALVGVVQALEANSAPALAQDEAATQLVRLLPLLLEELMHWQRTMQA
jgi:HPt (histidine-containing phosphotransfer) domain-containing protein